MARKLRSRRKVVKRRNTSRKVTNRRNTSRKVMKTRKKTRIISLFSFFSRENENKTFCF